MLRDFAKDLRYAARTLARSRGFTAIAILTLTLGIGATTAIFSVVDAVLLRPLPYRDPRRLVSFFEDLGKLGYPRARVSPPTYLDLKARNRVFEDVAAVNETSFTLSGGAGGAKLLTGALVTHNLFALLGAKPLLGSVFRPEEDRPGASHVVLLSFSVWQNSFAGNAGIVGQSIRLNGEPYTVAGVMPSGFSFPDREIEAIELWAPRAFTSQELAARRARYLTVVGRLRPGISLDEANADLRVLARQNARAYPNDVQGVSGFFAEPLGESNTHDVKRGLLMLMAAVGFILLIACASVANLLLSRAAGRRREIALRAALGARRSRILRQLLTESALLSIAGGALGACFAVASFAALKHLIPEDLSRTILLTFNLPMFGFTILISLASGFLFGLAPALEISKADLNEGLREGGRGSAGSRQTLTGVFVAAEVALSLLLLVCAGLLLKSLSNLQHVDPGFQSAHVLALDFDLAEPKYREEIQRTRFLERILDETRAARSAGLTGGLPFTSKGWTEEVTPEGETGWRDGPANPIYRVITPGYLETLNVRLIRGRFFDGRDREGRALVAIVNRKAAREFWPNQNPIGKRLKFGRLASDNPWIQVVGVTGDVKHSGLAEPSLQEVYCPYLQVKATRQWPRFLALRTSGDPLKVLTELRRIAARIDSQEPLNHVMTMSEIVDRETSQSKMQTTLLSGLAALALVMACVGIYGVMAYLVTQRTREIGVRMALGARETQIFGLVLKRGMTLTLIGVVIGVCAAVALTRLIGGLLFGISPLDSQVIVSVSGLLMAVALMACLIPARRAASIDPVHALRAE